MNYEHNNTKPDYFKEDWEGKWKVFSWLEFVCAIPHVLYMVTTIKENGLPNAAFQSWSSFTGEGDSFFVIMSGLMKHTHTYKNIKRDQEFCVNFITEQYLKNCWRSVEEHDYNNDEIAAAGFTTEASRSIKAPGIKESFLRLECTYEWEKELVQNSHNITICGKAAHVSVDEVFAKAMTDKKYGEESFMFNLHAPMNPFTGEFSNSGVGIMKYLREM